MSEMIERVTLAIADAMSEPGDVIELCGKAARAAIEAMRKPAIGQLFAGADYPVSVGVLWPELIDEALTDRWNPRAALNPPPAKSQ